MRVLWEFLTMLEGWIGSIWSIDNLDWSLLIWDNSVWFFFAFGLYIGDAVWASSLSLSWSSFLVVLFVLLIRRLTIFNALTFARWYALTVFSPRDLKMKRQFYTCESNENFPKVFGVASVGIVEVVSVVRRVVVVVVSREAASRFFSMESHMNLKFCINYLNLTRKVPKSNHC